MRRSLTAVASVIAALPVASAQELRVSAQAVPTFLSSQIQPGMTLEGLLTTSRRIYRDLDANGDGRLDQTDAGILETISQAGERSGFVGQIMRFDLDGDGSVTEEEVRTRLRYEQRAALQAATQQTAEQANVELRRIMAADVDKDRRVTWREAADLWAATANPATRTRQGNPTNIRNILAFAGRPQGALSPTDFDALYSSAFREIDADGNGTISQEELVTIRNRAQEQDRLHQAAAARADCVMPKASANAKVVLLSASEARALSTTAITSQDTETRSGRITIEAGTEPLFLVVLSSRAIIWRFEGAVERLERVILTSGARHPDSRAGKKPLVGATGLPADKVQFLPRYDCLSSFTEIPSTGAAGTTALVRNETGKEPIVSARYSVSGFSVPSGTVTPQPPATGSEKPPLIIQKQSGTLKVEGGANIVIQTGPVDLVSEVKRFYPDGVIEIDPAAVVTNGKAEPYGVLPGQAGLLQLVNSGALEQRGAEFHIKQKMRFPPGLYGAHSARFLLLRGVPLPDGSAGHSCVISEETGQSVAGARNPC